MRRRQIAWILILIVDVGYMAWGAGAAGWPAHLLGPGGKAILPAGYEGYSGGNVLFGLMGSVIAVTAFRRRERRAWWTLLVGNTVALLSAISYDLTVHAIGPFELTAYLGLVPSSGERLPPRLHSVRSDGQFERRAEMLPADYFTITGIDS
jgi:hypothetical protein